METFEGVVSDRGSKYAVSIARAASRSEVETCLKQLKKARKYAKATHNTWAVRLRVGDAVYDLKNDDGESGAGIVILRMLARDELENTLIVVTRWYGGKHLGGDRFRHVQTCVRFALERRS